MSDVFIKILNMSLSASWLILAVMVLRLLLKKAPRQSMCLLWGLVALKLIIPFSPESVLSLIPSNEVIPDNITMESHPHINSGIVYIDTAVNPVMESNLSPQIGDSVNPMQVVAHIAGIIWCIGVICCLAYALISFIRLKMKVRASKKIGRNIYACDEVVSPFILGIFRPVIYIPSGMGRETTDYVIAHENAHLKRGDHFWKPLGFIILSVYWFNPLCWVAYILLCRDIEYACDEKVIRDKDNEYVNSYSQALLDCNAQRKIIAACPLAFGETDVKGRIRGILNYKKTAFWVILISLIACVICAICFMTKPKQEEPETAIAEADTETAPDEGDTDPGDSYSVILQLTDADRNSVQKWYEAPGDIVYFPDGEYKVNFIDMTGENEYYGILFYNMYDVDYKDDPDYDYEFACSRFISAYVQSNLLRESMKDKVSITSGNGDTSYHCDLNGDGNNETIVVDYSKVMKEGYAETGAIDIRDSSGNIIWSDIFGNKDTRYIEYNISIKDDKLYFVKYYSPNIEEQEYDPKFEIYGIGSGNTVELIEVIEGDGTEKGMNECFKRAEIYYMDTFQVLAAFSAYISAN